ncbi:MAG: Sensor histidine kinase YpdA [Pseudomonadota bacterium]|jgi:sensor histidine kinase YesM
MTTSNSPTNFTPPSKWQPLKDAFHDYARWLVSISWKLFFGIAFVLMIAGGIVLAPQAALLIVLTSIVIKASYKQQIQAEEKASAATYLAEAEQLKRQLVEARLAAMQAQVEPHFLFNTLASIDHLIETDPPRASLMQKSLIALLRATLPSMRETNSPKLRNLGQELNVIRPYLDIQKMRMEDRLQIQWDIPEGLNSAEIPHMMVLSLVENAFKHGLEPKAEGGTLTLRAEVVHGQLEVTVRDTGVGYYPEESAGLPDQTGHGFGLKNIRDRLTLIHGDQAQFSIRAMEAYEGSGTLAKITVPYRVVPLEPQSAGV